MRTPKLAACLLGATLLLPLAGQADMMDFLVGKRNITVDQALKRGAQEMYKPLPAEAVAQLSAEEKLQYVLDNIYWAKVNKRFPEGKASAKAAVEGMKLLADTATPAEFVALWSMVDGKFIATLNGDDATLRTTRREKISDERTVTLYSLTWADIMAALPDYTAYRRQATADLLRLAAEGNFGACRVFETLYDTGVGSNPFAGKPDATWLDVNGVGQRRGLPQGVIDDSPPPLPKEEKDATFIPLPQAKTAAVVQTITIPLPWAVVDGCQKITSGGGDEDYRRMVEGHFRDIAKAFKR